MADEQGSDFLRLTAQIVSAHISSSNVATEALPALIESVYRSLSQAGAVPPEPAALSPAVPIKKSVFPEHIICLEDGKKLKMLKRHLKTSFNMTPADYRTKWGLPSDYPIVAPAYAQHRSGLAKKIGLGRKPAAMAEPDSPPITVGRARKARGANG